MKVIPYLIFKGKAEEAIKYYAGVFKGEAPPVMRFGDVPGDSSPPETRNLVTHGEVIAGDLTLYFSDSPFGVNVGNNVSILLDLPTEAEIDRVYEALVPGSTVQMPLGRQFWGAKYANLIDRYGVSWQLNFRQA